MSLITYKTPAKDKNTGKTVYVEKTGRVVLFDIGGKRLRFALQYDHGLDSAPALIHVPSGYVVIPHNTIAARKLNHYLHVGSYGSKLTDRDAARQCLYGAIDTLGGEIPFLEKLASVPVLNE